MWRAVVPAAGGDTYRDGNARRDDARAGERVLG
jgi:hypothetical protein